VKHRVIGIDLGTTYSAVATYDDEEDQAEIVPSPDDGQATTPSVVAFDGAERKVVVGWAAKQSLMERPQDAVIEIKREMGEVLDERGADRHSTPQRPAEGTPVRVHFADDWRLPQEISALILMRMKQVAEAELGGEIRDAVITVPAYFRETQRKATEQAALLAGLWPRQLVAEPTAAAICYGVDRYEPVRRAYLVYDLGGGTFDVSIIQVEGETIRVVATAGDHRLGGGDFDEAIVDWAVRELHARHRLDTDNEVDRPRIKYQAERAKAALSSERSVELVLDGLRRDRQLRLSLTREQFEELIDRDVRRSLESVDEAIRQAAAKGVTRDQLDAVLLVGGSTKIPKIRRDLVDRFGRGEDFVRADLDPAAVVARGAAMLASRFPPTERPFDPRDRPQSTTEPPETGASLEILPITEHSLGVGLEDGRCHRLIERGTAIPVSHTDRGFTNADRTDTLHVGVYQGEGEFYRENALIGILTLDNLEPLDRGRHRFDLTYSLDANGLLTVQAVKSGTSESWQARIDHTSLVQGDEALWVLHQRLKELYQGGRPPPSSGYQPPPPSPSP
jgi:molecular chaperone DnaK (HSP70)